MIDAARCGCLRIEKLEAMTRCLLSRPRYDQRTGRHAAETIAAVIADEAAIGMVNSKTTAVRLIPAIGKKVGEELSFGGLLGGGPVMPLNTSSPRPVYRTGRTDPCPPPEPEKLTKPTFENRDVLPVYILSNARDGYILKRTSG